VLEYVAATEADVPLLVGKELVRVAVPAEGEDEEEAEEGAPPKPPRGAGAGVSFDAIDRALAPGGEGGGNAYTLWLDALKEPRVKFWYMPRKGDFLAVPLIDSASGECVGLLGLDSLGGARRLTPVDCELAVAVGARLSDKLAALEEARVRREYEELHALQAAHEHQQVRRNARARDARTAGGSARRRWLTRRFPWLTSAALPACACRPPGPSRSRSDPNQSVSVF
jgi:hypothetical protein